MKNMQRRSQEEIPKSAITIDFSFQVVIMTNYMPHCLFLSTTHSPDHPRYKHTLCYRGGPTDSSAMITSVANLIVPVLRHVTITSSPLITQGYAAPSHNC